MNAKIAGSVTDLTPDILERVAAIGGEDDIVLALVPRKNGDDDIHIDHFLGMMAKDPDPLPGGEVDFDKALPPMWEGKYKTVMHELNADDPDSVAHDLTPDSFAAKQITHLALLEGPLGESDPFYFNAAKVTHNSFAFWYSQPRNKYYYMHCAACATGVLSWVTRMQPTWEGYAKATRN